MPDTQTKSERYTAYFILAVMVLALFWFVRQAGWLGGGSEEIEAPAAPPSPAKQITQRRGLILPVMELSELREQLDIASASALNENGINWLMVRLPVWTPSSRRFEYDSFAFENLAGIVETAQAAGMGVTLAPVYWDGSALHSTPPVPVNSRLFGHYRDLLLRLADIAAESRADALLLDGLFGSSAVSASEWVDLLAELRTKYSGRIEGRFDKGHIPVIFMNQLDGACMELSGGDSTGKDYDMLGALLTAYPDKGVTALMPESDRYASAGMPWQPVLDAKGGAADPENYLSTPFLSSAKCDGFFLSGDRAFRMLTARPLSEIPLARALRALRSDNIRKLLERGHREQTITQ